MLKSPKAAPVLPEVGVLSWAASTAASAPPWSLYETLFDILAARQRVQFWSLYSRLPAIYKLIFNGRLCNLVEKLPAEKKNFSEISHKFFLHAEAEAWVGQVDVTWLAFSGRQHIDLYKLEENASLHNKLPRGGLLSNYNSHIHYQNNSSPCVAEVKAKFT